MMAVGSPGLRVYRWIRLNLFGKPSDAILTLVIVPALAWAVWEIFAWALFDAEWDVVLRSLKVLMTGTFPRSELWRVWTVVGLVGSLAGLALSITIDFDRRTGFFGAVITALVLAAAAVSNHIQWPSGIVVAFFLFFWWAGTINPLLRRQVVPAAYLVLFLIFVILMPAGPLTWGGLLLSIIITFASALLTIPIGVVLAFGRQSEIASLRSLSAAYIEIMRGVPLILMVFFIWIAFPLVLPQFNVPGVVRGLIGFVLFYSAYAAEFIRSGIQAVAIGQSEAAESLGLSRRDTKLIIILPQALRVAVPGLVGNVLDIFNFAPLVFIIGLTDFLRAGQMILANPENSGRTYEVYLFMFVVYFIIGSAITFQARRLEEQLGRAYKR